MFMFFGEEREDAMIVSIVNEGLAMGRPSATDKNQNR